MSELDRMTQQNAALVEEGAAASESLKDQAQRLIHTIDHFQIGTSEAAPSMGRAPIKATVVASVHTAIASPKAAVSQPAAPARQAKLAVSPSASPSPGMTSRPSTPIASAAAKPPSTAKTLQAATSPVVPKTVAPAKPVVSPAPARTAVVASDDDWEEF